MTDQVNKFEIMKKAKKTVSFCQKKYKKEENGIILSEKVKKRRKRYHFLEFMYNFLNILLYNARRICLSGSRGTKILGILRLFYYSLTDGHT